MSHRLGILHIVTPPGSGVCSIRNTWRCRRCFKLTEPINIRSLKLICTRPLMHPSHCTMNFVATLHRRRFEEAGTLKLQKDIRVAAGLRCAWPIAARKMPQSKYQPTYREPASNMQRKGCQRGPPFKIPTITSTHHTSDEINEGTSQCNRYELPCGAEPTTLNTNLSPKHTMPLRGVLSMLHLLIFQHLRPLIPPR